MSDPRSKITHLEGTFSPDQRITSHKALPRERQVMNLNDTFGMIEQHITVEGGAIMNFIKRIKDGASRVTEKAQSSVEIGKLNGHISDIEREMEVEFSKMGKLFYEGYRLNDMSVAEGKMIELSRSCSKLQEKIDSLRSRIAELKNERLCTCGHVVALEANFCPYCGSKLEGIAPARQEPESFASVHSVQVDTEDDNEYFGEEELTEAEKEIAKKVAQHNVVYSEVLHPEEELPLDEYIGPEQKVQLDQRQADQLERERQRQLELDRQFPDWNANEHIEDVVDSEDNGLRDMIKCQICRNDLQIGRAHV